MSAGAALALSDLIRCMLGSPEASWSLGTVGAIAEFQHVDGDRVPQVRPLAGGGEVATARGAVRVRVSPETRAIACEGLCRRRDAWTQSLVLCLPQDIALMGGRPVLTDLGPDWDAVRPEDRTAILFDIGIGAPHLDLCIRTSDQNLIRLLRRGQGGSVLTSPSPALEAIKRSSPNRVCISRIGRIEVFQPIGSHRQQRPAPIGPHTHLLPKLLHNARHPQTGSMIPEGWESVFDLSPGNPVIDRLGRARPFDRTLNNQFQELLERYAPPGYMEEKLLVSAAVIAGMDPHLFAEDEASSACSAKQVIRQVTLRQMLHTHPEITAVRTWLAAQSDVTLPPDIDLAH